MTRPHAFETDDGALRCYLDQLPPDRCVFCNARTQARLWRVAGPVHYVTNHEALADGSAMERLAVGLAKGLRPTRAQSMQTRGRAWLAVCDRCAPKWILPFVCGLVILASTVVYAILNGVDGLLQTVIGSLIAMVAFGVAAHRFTLRVGEIDEDDHMFKLRRVAPEIVTEVVALGPEPHPRAIERANQLGHHVSGRV